MTELLLTSIIISLTRKERKRKRSWSIFESQISAPNQSTVHLLQDVHSPSTPGCQQSTYSRISTVRLLQDVNSPPTPGCPQSVYSRMSTVRLLQDVNSPSTPGCQQSVYSRMSKAPSASLGSGALYQCSLLKRAPYQAAPSASLGSGALYQLFPALGHYMVKWFQVWMRENKMIRSSQ